MEIRRLDPHDDAQMRRFHEIGWRAEKEDGRPWNSFWTYPEMAGMLREPTDDQRMDCFCVYDGDRMLAGGLVELSLMDNLDKAFAFPAVEPELRGRGLGSMLLEAMIEHARDNGRSQVTGMTAVPFEERYSSGLLRFADKHGFRLANTEIMRILRLPVREGLLEEVRRDSAGVTTGTPSRPTSTTCRSSTSRRTATCATSWRSTRRPVSWTSRPRP